MAANNSNDMLPQASVSAPASAVICDDNELQVIFERTARLAARLLSAPMALVCVERDDRCRVVAATGTPEPSAKSLHTLIDELTHDTHPRDAFVLACAPVRPLSEGASIGRVACASIMTADGARLACVCVLDQQRRSWNQDQLQALQDLCKSAAAEIELHRVQAANASLRLAMREHPASPNEMPFAIVFRAHPLPMTIHDFPEGRYLDVNEAWLAQTGFSRDEAIGKTSGELNVYVNSAERRKLFELITRQGYVRGLEADMRMKNGAIRRFLLTSQQVMIDGNIRLLSGTQDITEPKQAVEALRASEAQLSLITHALPVFILHCDTEFRYKFVNTAYALRLGVAPELLLGRRIRDVLGEQVWHVVEDKLTRVLDGELVQYEAYIPYPGIGVRCMRSVNVPERDTDGTVLGVIGVLIDITAQKQMEEERAQLLQQSLDQAAELRAADRRKDEFLAMLAHELRNPLAPINTAAHLLERLMPEENRARAAIEIVQRQVKHMTRLLEDLLDVSRITLGKITLREEQVDISRVVRAAVELTRPLIVERNHDVTVTPPAQPLLVSGDAARLAQVVSNLLNNAAKYTDDYGKISISAEREAKQVVIKVTDNGTGITPELLPRVFELFTQAERTLDRSQGGLGIGLALVKSLVTMHGGNVEARSENAGVGSEFIVRLPLLMQAASDRPGRLTVAPATNPRRILVVDDNVDAADSLAMLLNSEGHEVLVAYDSASAFAIARERPPQILLLDIGLPGTDGYALARRLRALTELRDATLIAVTGYGLPEDRERSKAAGFDHHLVKPIDFEVLRALLAEK
ncbi:MAG: ATP-binding protein [Betaproteobacteria bacterium]